MSPESDNMDSMRPEYDIRGGARGKYFERYRTQGTSVVFEESTLIVTSTAGAAGVAQVGNNWSASYQPPYPSPTIQLGTLEPAASGR